MASTIVESFFQRSLEDVVKGLRVQVIGEAQFLSKVLSEVRKEMKSTDVNTKAVALQKLTYLNMLRGTDMGWAAFHVVEVMSMRTFALKKIGYLGASQSFNASTDVLLLITNLLRKDFSLTNDHEASLSIDCFSRVGTADLARDLLPGLFTILGGTRAFVKKKTAVALYRVFTQYPDAMKVALKRLIETLNDNDPSVVSAAINVLCDLAMKNPKSFLPLAPQLYNLLIKSPNTWLCIKLVKMFRVMVELEPRLGVKIAEPICEIMRTSHATSLLLECIHTVTSGLTEQQSALELCVDKVNALLREDDTNVKYLCLKALLNLLPDHPWAIAANKEAIAACLIHRDPSVQQGARRLIIGMVSGANVIPTVSILLQCAFNADTDSCNELVSSILSTCSSDHYSLISDYSWYLSKLTEMARIPHCDCGDEIGRQLMEIGVTVKSATGDVLRAGRDLLLEVSLLDRAALQGVLKAAAWIAGEYAFCFVNLYELGEALLQPRAFMSLPASVRVLYVQAVFKILVYSWSKLYGKELSIETSIPDSQQDLAEDVSADRHMPEAGLSFKESPIAWDREGFSTLEAVDVSTEKPMGAFESHFKEESKVYSRDPTNSEQSQANGDGLQALLDGHKKSAVDLGEEQGRVAESHEQDEVVGAKEEQSWLRFLELTDEVMSGNRTALAVSSDVEMQERACNLLGLLQVVKDLSGFPLPPDGGGHSAEVQASHQLLAAMLWVLSVEFGSVSMFEQGRLNAAEGLILENLDMLGPTLKIVEAGEGVMEGHAFAEWEGRRFFSFPSRNPAVTGEGSVLLARHRQRHQNFYLGSEGKSVDMSVDYPSPVEAYLEPGYISRTHSMGSNHSRDGTKATRSKARPFVVKLDDEDDLVKPFSKSKERNLKDEFISSAITDLLSSSSYPVLKDRPLSQRSNRLPSSPAQENRISHSSSSRNKDGSVHRRGVSSAFAQDESLSNEARELGSGDPLSGQSDLSHENEKVQKKSAAGYEPQATELPRSSKGRSRPRRPGGHKGTSISKTQ